MSWIGVSTLWLSVLQGRSDTSLLNGISVMRQVHEITHPTSVQLSESEKLQTISDNIGFGVGNKILRNTDKIALSFQDISVRKIIQLLAEFSGLNTVVPDSVKGNISLKLGKVPWLEAFDLIIKIERLAIIKSGSINIVVPIDEMETIEKQMLETRQQIKASAPLSSELFQLRYAKVEDIAPFITENKGSLLSSRGLTSIDKRTNMMYVQDTSQHLERLRDFFKQIDIPAKQVLIQARIVRVTKDFAREIGIRWGLGNTSALANDGKGSLGVYQQGTRHSLQSRLNVDLPTLHEQSSPGFAGMVLARIAGDVLLDLELSALESEDKAKIISNPRLVTLNQRTAMIESGIEIPYQESTASGATAVSFKKAVLSLQVTPNITADKKIILDIIVNQDSPDFSREVLGTPPINTQVIKSNVLLNDGETIVLGGILQQIETDSYKRVPILGSMPGVGLLFRKKTTSVTHDELLIFITPTILEETTSEV